jgi:hypothetical protein
MMKLCSQCGSEISANSVFCPICGKHLEEWIPHLRPKAIILIPIYEPLKTETIRKVQKGYSWTERISEIMVGYEEVILSILGVVGIAGIATTSLTYFFWQAKANQF